MIQEIFSGLLGNKTIAEYIVAFIFVLIGVLVSIRVGAIKRDKDSKHTPYEFSYKFLTRDNIVRALASIGIAFVAIRFGKEITGNDTTEFGAFLIGLGFDQLVGKLNQWQKNGRS